ncbi:MAG: hypothetical protein JW973_10455 [Bacteroidales bacterium]|nr:hypothetical protein [Bacteroidales bacterium]
MRSIFVLLYIAVYSLSFAQTPEDVKNKEVMARNKVKQQTSWDYKYVGGKPDKNGVKTSVTLFSTSGEIAQVNAFNPAGAVLHTEKYNYDTRGNKTEYTRKSGDNSYQKKYVYNEKNLLIEESGFDGVENFRNLYAYDAHGNMTEIRYLKNSVLHEKRVFKKDGVTTTVSVYNKTGALTSKLVLIYDSRNNLIEESIYGINQSPLEKKTYNYDEKKKLKEEARYKLNKITIRNTYNYSPTGSLTEITEESPTVKSFTKKSMSYDAKGNLIEIKWRRNSSEEFNSISYQYNDKGLCQTADTYYPSTKYRVLTKYTYDFY